MRILIAIFLLGLMTSADARVPRSKRHPFAVHAVTTPSSIDHAGQAVFTFAIVNRSKSQLTLCLPQGFRVSTSCMNPDGSGVETMPGYSWTSTIGTSFNPETGEMHCRHFRYGRDDFVTLAPGERRLFDVPVTIAEDCNSTSAEVDISFDSEFDGSEIGLEGWKGRVHVGSYRLNVGNASRVGDRPSR